MRGQVCATNFELGLEIRRVALIRRYYAAVTGKFRCIAEYYIRQVDG